MDPNATLARIRALTAEVLVDEDTENTAAAGLALAEHVEALDAWLTRDGFQPAAWVRPVPPVALTALTTEEAEAFDSLFSDSPDRLALIRSQLDGRNVAVIAAVTSSVEGDILIAPLAVLVDDDLFSRLIDPATGLDD